MNSTCLGIFFTQPVWTFEKNSYTIPYIGSTRSESRVTSAASLYEANSKPPDFPTWFQTVIEYVFLTLKNANSYTKIKELTFFSLNWAGEVCVFGQLHVNSFYHQYKTMMMFYSQRYYMKVILNISSAPFAIQNK